MMAAPKPNIDDEDSSKPGSLLRDGGDHSLDRLHPAYESISKANRFFKPGRVFAAMWTEPAGPLSQDDANGNITKVNYDQYAFTKAARFISVRNQVGFCVALRINSFGGKGESKFSHRPPHLFFVHSADEANDTSWLGTNVAAVKVEDPEITFAVGRSVVLASKPYSVEHFLPIRNIGYVVKTSLARLESALLESLGKPSPETSATTAKKAATWPSPEPKLPKTLGNSAASSSLQSPTAAPISEIPMSTGDCPSLLFRGPGEMLVHKEGDEPEGYLCDYNCPKQGQLFNRIEHLRDHVRDFHLEDIPRNRNFGKQSKRIDWYNTRAVEKDWWRCKACMQRVQNSLCGWQCPHCHQPCEQDRVDHRMQEHPGHYDGEGFPLVFDNS